MITFTNPAQLQHAPTHEFFRGERVPCHETPRRAAFLLDALRKHGHPLREPDHDATAVLPRVHTPRYLAFLASAWDQWLALDAANVARQPFPSVWPVRSLRSDIEPDNFIARLGLYSLDNGTQSLFYTRDDVLVVNLHGDPRTEYPFYLGHADETGEGTGLGHNLNLPLPAGTSAERWFEALEVACQRVQQQGVDALVVSLGLDTFAGDPISTFKLQSSDYLRLGARLQRLGCPSLFVLEGGYAAAELGSNAANVLDGFEGG